MTVLLVAVLLSLPSFGCTSSHQKHSNEEVKMPSVNNDIQVWVHQLGNSLDETTALLGVEADMGVVGGYGNTAGLVRYSNGAKHPGHFYFEGSELVLIYVSGGPLGELSGVEVAKSLGEPTLNLTSRAGKRFRHLVWVDLGIGISFQGSEIAFVEVFPQMESKEWKNRFYKEPPAFIK